MIKKFIFPVHNTHTGRKILSKTMFSELDRRDGGTTALMSYPHITLENKSKPKSYGTVISTPPDKASYLLFTDYDKEISSSLAEPIT